VSLHGAAASGSPCLALCAPRDTWPGPLWATATPRQLLACREPYYAAVSGPRATWATPPHPISRALGTTRVHNPFLVTLERARVHTLRALLWPSACCSGPPPCAAGCCGTGESPRVGCVSAQRGLGCSRLNSRRASQGAVDLREAGGRRACPVPEPIFAQLCAYEWVFMGGEHA